MIYFVDMENIPYAWAEYLHGATGNDEFLLFYGSVAAPKFELGFIQALLSSPAKVRCIPCYPGTNAMDFQLCSELGYRIAQSKKASYSIVSKDSGYDPVVKHWKDLGVSINRIVPQMDGQKAVEQMLSQEYLAVLSENKKAAKKAVPAKEASPPKKKQPAKPTATTFHELLKSANSNVPGPALQSMSTMMEKSLSLEENKRMYFIYSMMFKKYNSDGRKYYNKLKPVISKALLGAHA